VQFNSLNLMQKVRFTPNATWDFNLGIHYATTSDYDRYDRLIRERDGVLRSAEWFYGPQKWFMTNFQINKEGNGAFYDRAQATITYQNSQESRNERDFNDTDFFETDENVDAYSLGLDFTKNLKNRKNKLYYGLEFIHNRVGSDGQVTDITTGIISDGASRYPDGSTWSSLAAYASVQLDLSTKTKLQSGLRYNQVWVDANFISKVIGIKANVGTAFRAPNVDDVGKIFDSEPGSVVVPNPDLKAEYAYNTELGFNFNIKNKSL